ncbi:MAG: hypothetical protein IJZ47_12130 [Oscillospiraceae bacterium]|nr:hypothetical protein [Oscillospiraceae bacterium]
MKRAMIAIAILAAMMTVTACSDDVVVSAGQETSEVTQEQSTTQPVTSATTSAAATSATEAESSEPVEVPEPEVWDPAVIQRQVMQDEGCMCGVAYIGFVDGESTKDDCRNIFYNSRYAEDFEFITDIPDENVIDTGIGYELYLIIPQDTGATVSVNEWVFDESNDFMGAAGEVYYRSENGAPVLVKCNFSDIMPSTVVNIVDSSGNTLSWSPSLSLKDGSVSRYGVENQVYDFTHYIYNETYDCYMIEGDPQ